MKVSVDLLINFFEKAHTQNVTDGYNQIDVLITWI